MPTVRDRVKFCEQYITAPDGEPFSLKGREWVIDQYWKPLSGWRLWPAGDPEKMCAPCMRAAGGIVETYQHRPRCRSKSKRNKCTGLETRPILITVLCIKRQSGKSFNTAADNLSTIFKTTHEYIGMIAGSEQQALDLMKDNYEAPIDRSDELKERATVVGNRVTCPANNSKIVIFPSNHAGVTARTLTRVVIDEARDVTARTAMAIMESIGARGGWECPTKLLAHTRSKSGVDNPDAPKKCTVCKKPTQPWHGRILIMSAAGIMEGGEKDWFGELVEELQSNPDPNAHLFYSADDLNPKKSKEVGGAIERIFSKLPTTKTYADVEGANVFRQKGEDFLTKEEIDRCIDGNLTNKAMSTLPGVAFLDTSKTKELTSLVINCDETSLRGTSDEASWSRLVCEFIKIWDPAKMPGGVIDEFAIEAALDKIVPCFALVELMIDVRVMPWAIRLYNRLRKKPYKKIITACHWKDAERDAAWQQLETKILNQHQRMPRNKILRAELRAARARRRPDGRTEVREASRRLRHLDVAEGLASTCYLAHIRSLQARLSLSASAVHSKNTKVSAILKKLYRPTTHGINTGNVT